MIDFSLTRRKASRNQQKPTLAKICMEMRDRLFDLNRREIGVIQHITRSGHIESLNQDGVMAEDVPLQHRDGRLVGNRWIDQRYRLIQSHRLSECRTS